MKFKTWNIYYLDMLCNKFVFKIINLKKKKIIGKNWYNATKFASFLNIAPGIPTGMRILNIPTAGKFIYAINLPHDAKYIRKKCIKNTFLEWLQQTRYIKKFVLPLCNLSNVDTKNYITTYRQYENKVQIPGTYQHVDNKIILLQLMNNIKIMSKYHISTC